VTSTPQQGSGVHLSWPMFFVLIAVAGGFMYWLTREAVDGKEIGRSAMEGAAEVMPEQMDKIAESAVDAAIDAAADEAAERSGDFMDDTLDRAVESLEGVSDRSVGEVPEETADEAGEETETRPRNISIGGIFETVEQIKDDVLRESADQAFDLMPIDIDEEWATGAEIGDSIREQFDVVQNDTINDRVLRLARPMLPLLTRTKGREYTFTVYHSNEVNAFAILGGQIFIATALIDRMETDAAIQAVIAHEIGHVEWEHSVRAAWAGQKSREILGQVTVSNAIQSAFHVLVRTGYSEQQQFDADEFAFRMLHTLGRPRHERLRFVEVLLELEAEYAQASGGTKTEPGNPLLDALDRHYRTHPPSDERYEALDTMQDDDDWRP